MIALYSGLKAHHFIEEILTGIHLAGMNLLETCTIIYIYISPVGQYNLALLTIQFRRLCLTNLLGQWLRKLMCCHCLDLCGAPGSHCDAESHGLNAWLVMSVNMGFTNQPEPQDPQDGHYSEHLRPKSYGGHLACLST